jgi:hypothetical protein
MSKKKKLTRKRGFVCAHQLVAKTVCLSFLSLNVCLHAIHANHNQDLNKGSSISKRGIRRSHCHELASQRCPKPDKRPPTADPSAQA